MGAEMSTALQGPATELTGPSGMSVAVIGPNTAHRKIVTKALGGSSARTVREFSDYPAKLSDVPRMVEQNYDVVMIDVDSDQSYALALIENFAELNRAMVVAYSKRNDPELLLTCMRAGAREFLPLPDDENPVTGGTSQAVAPAPGGSEFQRIQPQGTPETRGDTNLYVAKAADPPPHPRLNDVAAPEPVPLDFNAWDLAHLHPSKPVSVNAPDAQPGSGSAKPAKKENHRERGRVRPAQSITTLGLDSNSRSKTVPELFAKSAPSVPELFNKSEPTVPELFIKTEPPPVPEPSIKSMSWLDAMDDVAQTTARVRPKIDLEAIGPIFRADLDEEENSGHKTMYWVILSAGSGLLVGLLALVYMHPFGQTPHSAPAAQVDTPHAVMAPLSTEAPTPVAKVRAATGAPTRVASAGSPAQTEQVSSEMMNAQLAAPARITGDMKKPAPAEEPEPASVSPGTMEDGASVPGPLFINQHKIKVEPAASAISAGVAEGMLVHRTAPVYPQFARDGHMSGTVILGATISKAGTIQGLHVISGPPLFRNAAVDAVKSWRYRPYMLDNQPVAVDTTVKVVFSVDQH
jgi:TonB family protein